MLSVSLSSRSTCPCVFFNDILEKKRNFYYFVAWVDSSALHKLGHVPTTELCLCPSIVVFGLVFNLYLSSEASDYIKFQR